MMLTSWVETRSPTLHLSLHVLTDVQLYYQTTYIRLFSSFLDGAPNGTRVST
jgi:hypothetical protein